MVGNYGCHVACARRCALAVRRIDAFKSLGADVSSFVSSLLRSNGANPASGLSCDSRCGDSKSSESGLPNSKEETMKLITRFELASKREGDARAAP